MRAIAGDVAQLEGGVFPMGSDRFYPEEGPAHEVTVDAFEIDRFAVTNYQFAAFVADTDHVTVAERAVDHTDVPGGRLVTSEPGSLVFRSTAGPVDLHDWRQWWTWVPGADWRHPQGPDSTIEGMHDHPVVQVAFADAQAYAAWVGMRLPTEAEWEFAARGGLVGATYAWGEESNDGARFANTWQGRFPYRNDGAAGWRGTAPVGSFPSNGYGLYDMTGNTWEWTSERWTDRHAGADQGCGCSAESVDTSGVGTRILKGGSYLCAPSYCLRYRPAARSPQTADSAATHIGFRCVR